MNTQELILDMLTNLDRKVESLDKKINEKIDSLDKKIDEKLTKLPCEERSIRIDRLEQKEIERKEHKNLIWGALFAGIGAFGLGIWNWLKSQ